MQRFFPAVANSHLAVFLITGILLAYRWTPPMLSTSPPPLSSEEQEQILQTIEMFEVITQANPQDCQSMDILKDAYQRVGKLAEALAITRKLADTYVDLGQYSAAMLEYEGILQKDAGNVEVVAKLAEVEQMLQKTGQLKPAPEAPRPPSRGIDLDFQTVVSGGGTLMATNATLRADGSGKRLASEQMAALADDGNEPLAKFLIQHRLASEEIVSSALERVHKKNKDLAPNVIALSLIDEICRRGSIDIDTILAGVIDRSKFAFIPLHYYDVDRAIVKMLPENLTIGRLMVPFDVLSRTIMIATANPFDAVGKEAVQQLLDYHVQWHLAPPQAIAKVLSETYRLDK
jgi:hypothetical protein